MQKFAAPETLPGSRKMAVVLPGVHRRTTRLHFRQSWCCIPVEQPDHGAANSAIWTVADALAGLHVHRQDAAAGRVQNPPRLRSANVPLSDGPILHLRHPPACILRWHTEIHRWRSN